MWEGYSKIHVQKEKEKAEENKRFNGIIDTGGFTDIQYSEGNPLNSFEQSRTIAGLANSVEELRMKTPDGQEIIIRHPVGRDMEIAAGGDYVHHYHGEINGQPIPSRFAARLFKENKPSA